MLLAQPKEASTSINKGRLGWLFTPSVKAGCDRAEQLSLQCIASHGSLPGSETMHGSCRAWLRTRGTLNIRRLPDNRVVTTSSLCTIHTWAQGVLVKSNTLHSKLWCSNSGFGSGKYSSVQQARKRTDVLRKWPETHLQRGQSDSLLLEVWNTSVCFGQRCQKHLVLSELM